MDSIFYNTNNDAIKKLNKKTLENMHNDSKHKSLFIYIYENNYDIISKIKEIDKKNNQFNDVLYYEITENYESELKDLYDFVNLKKDFIFLFCFIAKKYNDKITKIIYNFKLNNLFFNNIFNFIYF